MGDSILKRIAMELRNTLLCLTRQDRVPEIGRMLEQLHDSSLFEQYLLHLNSYDFAYKRSVPLTAALISALRRRIETIKMQVKTAEMGTGRAGRLQDAAALFRDIDDFAPATFDVGDYPTRIAHWLRGTHQT